MKAAVYEGPRKVTVKDVPDAKIEHPCDIVVEVTSTNICGSDLHMYEGRTSFETGRALGHENLGRVVEVGSGVSKVRIGEYVVLPFNIACGFCKQCERGLTNYCLTMQPEPAMVAPPTGSRTWARTRAVRRSCCACRTATSTRCDWARTRRSARSTT